MLKLFTGPYGDNPALNPEAIPDFNNLILKINEGAAASGISLSTGTVVSDGSNTPRALQDRFAERVNVKDFGALGDTQQETFGITIGLGSNRLMGNLNIFSPTDVGKAMQVVGAGAAGGPLIANISGYVSPTTVLLDATAGTALTGGNTSIFWGTDDSAAVASAINYIFPLVHQQAKGVIWFPAGNYYIKKTALPLISSACVGVKGDGRGVSTIVVDPTYPGSDLFSWSNCFNNGVGANLSQFTYGNKNWGAVEVRDIAILGNLKSASSPTCFGLYDLNSFFLFDNIDVSYWPGTVLQCGVNGVLSTKRYLIESAITNFRAFRCGTPSTPVIDFGSMGNGDATNEIYLANLNIFEPQGDGLSIHTTATVNPIRLIKGFGLRFEAIQSGFSAIHIGDQVSVGLGIFGCQFYGLELVSGVSGSIGITMEAPSGTATALNTNMVFEGIVVNDHGVAVNVTNGANIDFVFHEVSGTDASLVVNNPLGAINFSGIGVRDATFSLTNVAGAGAVYTPSYSKSSDGVRGANFSADAHDGTTSGGGGIGLGSVDLQQIRTQQTQSAVGAFSFVGAGQQNSTLTTSQGSAVPAGIACSTSMNYSFAGGNRCTTAGLVGITWGNTNILGNGSQNVAFGSGLVSSDGANNVFLIGNQGSAVSSGRNVQSGGQISQVGDSQLSTIILKGSTAAAAAIAITADGSAALSPTNIASLTIPGTHTAYAVEITLMAMDKTANGNWFYWKGSGVVYTNGGAAGTTFAAVGSPTTQSLGTGSTASVSIVADTTNGGIYPSWTPPTANANTWHVTAKVSFTEVA